MCEPSSSPPIFFSAGDSARITGELHGRGVGQELALSADGRLDQIAEEDAEIAQDYQRQPEEEDRRAAVVLPIGAAGRKAAESQYVVAENCQDKDAVDHADQPQIQPHVAVENVAELMAHHPLQLFAGEISQRAGRDGHDRVTGLMARGEGIDRRLIIHHKDGRHRNARGQGHLLDDVQQPAFGQVGALRIDGPAAHHQGDGLAAGRQLGDLVETPQGDHQQCSRRDAQEKLGPPQAAVWRRRVVFRLAVDRVVGVRRFGAAQSDGHHQIDCNDDRRHRQSE